MFRNNTGKLFIFILLVITFSSCKSKQSLISGPGLNTGRSSADPINAPLDRLELKTFLPPLIDSAELHFTSFSSKAKGSLSLPKMKTDVNVNIRIQKDKIIWVSISAVLGVEITRIYITPDSVKLINKIDNIYIKKPISYLSELTNQYLDFYSLQSILTGNKLRIAQNENDQYTLEDNLYIITGMKDDLTYANMINYNYKTTIFNVQNLQGTEKASIMYRNFETISGQQIPMGMTISTTKDAQEFDLSLQYSKVILEDTLSFPFTVPKRFN